MTKTVQASAAGLIDDETLIAPEIVFSKYDPLVLSESTHLASYQLFAVHLLDRAAQDYNTEFQQLQNPKSKFAKYNNQERQRAKDSAIKWVHSNSEDLYSFIWCCEALNWNPDWIRKNFHKWNPRAISHIHNSRKNITEGSDYI